MADSSQKRIRAGIDERGEKAAKSPKNVWIDKRYWTKRLWRAGIHETIVAKW